MSEQEPADDPGIEALQARLARTADRWNQDLHCGPGWYPLLARLDADLADLAPDYKVIQVKEKFGGLRFYWTLPEGTDATEEVRAAMTARMLAAEEEAWVTCEQCGAPGTVAGRHWLRTLCEPCRAARARPDSESESA